MAWHSAAGLNSPSRPGAALSYRHDSSFFIRNNRNETMPTLTTIISTVSAAFLASLVEFVEAFTIVLAVGLTQSWRPAFVGSAIAVAVLAALVLLLGPLLALVPLDVLQFVIGV